MDRSGSLFLGGQLGEGELEDDHQQHLDEKVIGGVGDDRGHHLLDADVQGLAEQVAALAIHVAAVLEGKVGPVLPGGEDAAEEVDECLQRIPDCTAEDHVQNPGHYANNKTFGVRVRRCRGSHVLPRIDVGASWGFFLILLPLQIPYVPHFIVLLRASFVRGSAEPWK